MLSGLSLLAAPHAYGGVYTMGANKDTYLNEAAPTTNYDTSLDLAMSSSAGARKHVLLQYDLPSIPSTEEVQSAVLRFWITNDGVSLVDVHRVSATWNSAAVTWTAPASYDPAVRGSFNPAPVNAFVDVDVTGLVRDWLKGAAANHGIVLIIRPTTTASVLQSREATPDTQDPLLVVTTVTKPQVQLAVTSTVVSDPIRGVAQPKRIPGAVLNYTLTLTNVASGTTDPDTVSIVRPVPAASDLYVGDLGAVGSGPLIFAQGAPASGLSYTFSGLSSMTDDLSFSNDGGTTFTYVPVPDGNGYDAAVTHVRLTPKGALAAAGPGGSPTVTGTLQLRAK